MMIIGLTGIQATLLSLSLAAALFLLFMKHSCRPCLSFLPGPASSSWLAGHLSAFWRDENVGDSEFSWIKKYGMAIKIKGIFNEHVLLLSDPKGIQYVLNTGGYTFHKPREILVLSRVVTGPGILASEGDGHVRHRRIMSPGFQHAALKGYFTMFGHSAQKASSKLRDMLFSSPTGSEVINIYKWVSNIALDTVGEAVFNFDFGALDNAEVPLTKAYNNVFTQTFYNLSDLQIVLRSMWRFLPIWTGDVLHAIPWVMNQLQAYSREMRHLSTQIVARDAYRQEEKSFGRDVISMLLKANTSEDPKVRLNDTEIVSQMMTLMLAGHETTGATLTWIFYELSRHPEVQEKIREEIKNLRAVAAARGDDQLNMADFESMAYLLACIKETLRFHPIAPHAERTASRDETIPLSTPQMSTSGETITSIPVKKGQKLVISFCGYNRLKSVWGEDADQWRPERFLKSGTVRHKVALGLVDSLASFGSGIFNCLGWHFALLEMQSIIIELVENFSYAPAPGEEEIIRAPTMTMTPMVKGKREGGTQLPLIIMSV